MACWRCLVQSLMPMHNPNPETPSAARLQLGAVLLDGQADGRGGRVELHGGLDANPNPKEPCAARLQLGAVLLDGQPDGRGGRVGRREVLVAADHLRRSEAPRGQQRRQRAPVRLAGGLRDLLGLGICISVMHETTSIASRRHGLSSEDL